MIWLNGEFHDEDDAKIAASSAGNLLGWGVFTTVGIWSARPFALRLHLTRLRHDALKIGIEFPFDDQTLIGAVEKLVAAQQISRGILRLTLTQRADGRWNTVANSDFSILAKPISSTRDGTLRIALSPFRVHSQRATSGLKTTSYLDCQLAWREVQSRGFDEAVLRNERDEICEGARSNLFFLKDETLCAPHLRSGCLPGIARGLILGWARESEFTTREDAFFIDDLRRADAIFLSAAAMGIRAVEEFHDGETTHLFTPKKMTLQLQERWNDATSSTR